MKWVVTFPDKSTAEYIAEIWYDIRELVVAFGEKSTYCLLPEDRSCIIKHWSGIEITACSSL